mgnify:CR=1 FL=1
MPRSAAAMGDTDNAIRWLMAAADAAASEGNTVLGQVMDRAPELTQVRARPEYPAIRARVTPAGR